MWGCPAWKNAIPTSCPVGSGSPFAVYSGPDTAFVAQFLGTSSYVEDFTKFKGYEAYQLKKGTGAVIRSEFMEKALQSI